MPAQVGIHLLDSRLRGNDNIQKLNLRCTSKND